MKNFEPEKELNKKIFSAGEVKLHNECLETKTVLGIDIYKYSEYQSDIQEYVPVLFNSLYRITVDHIVHHEEFIFQKYGVEYDFFKQHFISTGDGGFQIFDNPLQALVFAAYFQMNVRRFNSGSSDINLNINLCNIIGRIELRYAITTEKIFAYDNNFYGQAIINCARILAKDQLNRLLSDFASLDWFDKNINTMENLLVIQKADFMKTNYFTKYDDRKSSLLFDKGPKQIIKTVDVLKIGAIKSKNTILDIYNLRIQFGLSVTDMVGYNRFVVTLGNLNTHGIE